MDELTKLKIRNAELEAALASAQNTAQVVREELIARERELDLLHQFDRELTRSEDLEFVLNHVLTWTKLRTQADYGIVARWDERRKVLEILRTNGFPLGKDYQQGDVLEMPPSLVPKEAVSKVTTGLLFDPSQTFMVSEMRHADGKLIGVLVMQRHSGIKFNSNDKKFTRLIADRLAISMHMSTLLKQVADSSENREQLFRLLSHNLRQPLTVLAGYIQLIEYNLTRGSMDNLGGYIKNVSKGATDFNELLEEVLLVERVSSLSPDSWETISLTKICQAAIEKHRSQAELLSHQLVLEFAEEEAFCKGLETELKAAASNLLGNAIKYTPQNGKIVVRLYRKGAHWHFEVEDNGYGIDKHRQNKIFQSFYRAQQPGTENIKGTGLGLNLVKKIIEKHDGGVYFSSEVGVGSTFGFWIPAC